jgi:pimeloyl-ACP methyl ester carboxylesterase
MTERRTSRAAQAERARRRRQWLAATEPARAAMSIASLLAGAPFLALAPRGEPHPVLVLPGLMASDVSTGLMRAWLRRMGYPVVGWELGRNRGPTQEIVEALPPLLERLATKHGLPVSIIGQSLGGIYARRLAVRAPHHVQQVITLGSPFGSVEKPFDNSPGARAYQRYSSQHTSQRISPGSVKTLPVPSTAIYSRWDGVVDWRACVQPEGPTSENVAVYASHLGMGVDPAVLWVIADRLAQPANSWRPFAPPARWGLGALFPQDGGAGTGREP